MEKLLNPNAARNIFNHGKEAHGFFKNGGANYISAASMNFADPNAQALTNVAASKGATLFMAGAEYGNAPKAEEMMKNADRELLKGERISGAEMSAVDPDQAVRMVEKAEQQITNNKMAEKMAVNNQTITR